MTPAAKRLLATLLESEEHELVFEPGAGWWVDNDRVGPKAALEVVRACLVHCDHVGSRFERWTLREAEARRVLAGDEPEIVKALRERGR